MLTASSVTGCAPALKDVFAKDFFVGGALNYDQIYSTEPKETAIVTKHFSTITPENILKWARVHPEPNRYNFEPADKFVEFGEKNDMFIVGHTLVWHWQTPKWVFVDNANKPLTRDALLARMKDHIYTVVGHYKGRVKGWDVVNEALDDNGQLRKTKWLEIIGEDFIAKAFEYAHEADPDAELYYNDFDMCKPSKFAGVIRLVKDLQSKGIRIDGVGMQGHWDLDYPTPEELEAAILAYSQLGVKVMVTEMDVSVLPSAYGYRGADIAKKFELRKELNPYPDGLPAEMQEKLAKRYAELFSVFHKHADKISRITFWGVQDGNSWRNHWPIRGRTDYPLLFGRDCKPKPAFDAVIKVVQNGK
jgi:endo-1,4-beta-xylanase